MKEMIMIFAALNLMFPSANTVGNQDVASHSIVSPTYTISLQEEEMSAQEQQQANNEEQNTDESNSEDEQINTDNLTCLGTYKLTGYCASKECTGKNPSDPAYGITASGVPAVAGVTVAMESLPFGTKIYIEGLGVRIVQDRGVTGNIVDIYCDTYSECFDAAYNRPAKIYLLED